MAFGFPPKHIQAIPLNGLSREHFLVIAVETAKKLKWEVFYISSAGFMANAHFLLGSWTEKVQLKILESDAEFRSESIGGLADLGRNRKNAEQFESAFLEMRQEALGEDLDRKYEEFREKFVPAEQDVLVLPPSKTKTTISDFLAMFRPVHGYFVTPLLVNLNILIFLLMAISGVHILEPEGEDLIRWGANFRPVTLDGEEWRLVTCCFLHIGIIHLLMNLYALVYIGLFLEPLMGSRRFLAAYLLTGIAASATSLWWNDLVVSAGASGAIFGMYGVFLAMLTTNLVSKSFRKAILTSILLFVIYNLAYGLKGGIDNAAHIGGLVSGLIAGYAFYPSLKKRDDMKLEFLTTGIIAVAVVASSFMVMRNTPNNIAEYDKKMEEFARLETLALELYQLPGSASDEQILKEINTRGIYYWQQCIDLIQEADSMELPEIIHERNQKLLEYCNLRKKSYDLIARAIEEQTDFYDTQIEACVRDIETVIQELSGQE